MCKHKYLLLLFLLWQTIAFAQKGNIKGKVADNGGGLPSVMVAIQKNVFTATELDGTFQLIGVDTGAHLLKVTYMGYQPLEVPVKVSSDQTVDLGTIELLPTQTLMKEVQVTGNYRQGGQAKAINMTRNANKAITVLSAEGISKSPVRATAQVIRQAPGVAVKEDKVSLRGTPVDWTTSLLNGDPMPTADEKDASRVFNFEVFPSSLIDYIVVNRTVTPDMDGDNIGGIINFMTKASATERSLALDVSTGYDAITQKPLLIGNFLWGDISKNKKLSYTVNGSYNADNYGKDEPSVAYGTNYNHSLARLQLDKARGFRQTAGGNVAVNYEVNNRFTLGANVMGGIMVEDECRYRTSYNWSDGSGQRIRLWNTRGVFEHELYGGAMTASWKLSDKLRIDGRVATYSNSFRFGKTPSVVDSAPNGNYTVEYISPLLEYTDMIMTDFFGNAHDPNNAKDPNPYPYKMLAIDNPYGNGGDHYKNIQPGYRRLGGSTDPLTTEDYYLSSVYADMNTTTEKDPVTGKLDVFYTLNNKLKLQAGFRYRSKEGARNVSFYEYRLKPGTMKMPLSEQPTEAYDTHGNYLKEWNTPYKDALMPVLTNDRLNSFVDMYRDSLVSLPMDIKNNEYRYWAGSGYTYTEEVKAGYLMSEWKPTERLSFTGGVRLEHTRLKQTSDTIVNDVTAPIGINALPVSIERNYLAVLPSLNAVYAPGKSDNIRAAVSRTFHRPNFEQTKPGYAMYDRVSYLFTFGNPDLKPTYSLNFDLSYEHYWGVKGMFSIGGYYKHITDHIFRTNQIDETQTVSGYVVKGYQNARTSKVAGIEALIERKLTFLPGFWNGFGVSANITASWSQMDVPGRTKSQRLPEQTPIMYNAALFYEKGKLSTRLVFNYTGAFSTELNLFTDIVTNELVHDNTDYDVFVAEMYSLDYQFSYALSKRFNLYANVNNILNTPYRTYIGVVERPLQTAYTRQKFYLGLRFSL